ncbi:MAG: cytochrome c3 family protein [Phycisphaerae bacterium]
MSGDCDACHEPTAPTGHRFRLVEQRAALCEACHDEFDDDVVHQPVADGQCTTCHDPHAADVSGLLTEPSVGALCRQCHEDVTDGLTFLHGPVAAGACTACHDPHAAEHASLLPTEDRALCVGCHAPLADRMAGLEHVHEPARSSCLACHNPHGADNRRNLASGVPELCTDCHDTIADIMEDAEFQHDALTTGRSCLACHDPHATSVAHTLRAEPLTLCLSCHDKTLDTGGETVRNIAAVLAANPDHHGPVRDGDCTACHEVHGGDHFRMLVDAYPAGFYAPFDESRYALCFGCHDVEMLEDEETDDLTNFRNGERNLHYLHVNRDVKGRSCRACHDPHASKRPVHIAESAPFGQWRIPINFSKTDTGGSCAPGCHKRYRYDRIEPVVNLPPAADPGAVSAGSATGTVAKKD